MPIRVNILLSTGGRFKPVSSHTLHEKRITVGRDKECTLSLEDTQKHVSRVHAEFEQDEDSYWIKVVSKVNPIAVNGKRFSYGDRVPIAAGDQVTVGMYRLEIVEADVAPQRSRAAAAPVSPAVEGSEESTVMRPQVPASPVSRPSPAAPARQADEEETFLRSNDAPPPAAPEHKPPAPPIAKDVDEEEDTYVPPSKAVPPPSQAPAGRSAVPESAMLDDEVTYIPPMWARMAANRDALGQAPDTTAEDLTYVRRPSPAAPPAASAAPSAVPQAAPPAPPSVEVAPPVPAMELDFDLSEAFDSPAARVPDKAPAPKDPIPDSEVEEGFSEDLTYVRRPSKPAAAQPAAPIPNPAPPSAPEKPQYRSPLAEIEARIAAKASAPKTAPEPQPAHAAEAGADGAMLAFLAGAGLSHLSISDPEKFMLESGRVVRAAVEGIVALLHDRAVVRKELGVALEPGADDNPVTATTNAANVLAFLFDPKRPAVGYIDPAEAFSAACDDLRAHQAALVAAMRSAVITALLRTDPKKIERENSTGLGILNITRKSKLWDLSAAQHEELAREIEQDFGSVFAEEILAAFTEQARKIREGR